MGGGRVALPLVTGSLLWDTNPIFSIFLTDRYVMNTFCYACTDSRRGVEHPRIPCPNSLVRQGWLNKGGIRTSIFSWSNFQQGARNLAEGVAKQGGN